MKIDKGRLFKIIVISSIFCLGFVFKKDVHFSNLSIKFVENEFPNYIDSLDILNDCPLLLDYYPYSDSIDINKKLLEDSITNIDYVYNAEVYLQDNSLTILVEQNNPFLRFEELGQSYYLNQEGKKMLATNMNLADVLFFSGDTMYINQICDLANCIYQDSFMNSLIKGIHFDKDIGYIFYPRIFDIEIIFGDTLGMKNKFDRIKTFYGKVSKNSSIIDDLGNLNIMSINVKYENQIICQKNN